MIDIKALFGFKEQISKPDKQRVAEPLLVWSV